MIIIGRPRRGASASRLSDFFPELIRSNHDASDSEQEQSARFNCSNRLLAAPKQIGGGRPWAYSSRNQRALLLLSFRFLLLILSAGYFHVGALVLTDSANNSPTRMTETSSSVLWVKENVTSTTTIKASSYQTIVINESAAWDRADPPTSSCNTTTNRNLIDCNYHPTRTQAESKLQYNFNNKTSSRPILKESKIIISNINNSDTNSTDSASYTNNNSSYGRQTATTIATTIYKPNQQTLNSSNDGEQYFNLDTSDSSVDAHPSRPRLLATNGSESWELVISSNEILTDKQEVKQANQNKVKQGSQTNDHDEYNVNIKPREHSEKEHSNETHELGHPVSHQIQSDKLDLDQVMIEVFSTVPTKTDNFEDNYITQKRGFQNSGPIDRPPTNNFTLNDRYSQQTWTPTSATSDIRYTKSRLILRVLICGLFASVLLSLTIVYTIKYCLCNRRKHRSVARGGRGQIWFIRRGDLVADSGQCQHLYHNDNETINATSVPNSSSLSSITQLSMYHSQIATNENQYPLLCNTQNTSIASGQNNNNNNNNNPFMLGDDNFCSFGLPAYNHQSSHLPLELLGPIANQNHGTNNNNNQAVQQLNSCLCHLRPLYTNNNSYNIDNNISHQVQASIGVRFCQDNSTNTMNDPPSDDIYRISYPNNNNNCTHREAILRDTTQLIPDSPPAYSSLFGTGSITNENDQNNNNYNAISCGDSVSDNNHHERAIEMADLHLGGRQLDTNSSVASSSASSSQINIDNQTTTTPNNNNKAEHRSSSLEVHSNDNSSTLLVKLDLNKTRLLSPSNLLLVSRLIDVPCLLNHHIQSQQLSNHNEPDLEGQKDGRSSVSTSSVGNNDADDSQI